MLNIKNTLTPRLLGAAIAAAALITPALASAQDVPSYASADATQQIQGTVSSINGTWNITVADANGYSDSVELHQGTIINPTGLTLEAGMNVTIDGYPDGPNFDAVEIDTPYQYQGPPPVAVYYGPGAWYPGYAYGWGPSFSLFFDFSSRRFEQRSFDYAGQVRHAMAPPSGWENRPHGYIGNAGGSQRSYAPPSQSRYTRSTVANVPPQQARTFSAPPQQARSFSAPPQQARTFSAPPQQARTFSAPPQQARTFSAPPQQARTFSAPPQQARTFSAPPQQARTFSAPPQQARTFSAPPQQARTFSAPPQQARTFSAPPQQARTFSAPAARAAAPVARGSQDGRRGG
jgi:hypothetical protein